MTKLGIEPNLTDHETVVLNHYTISLLFFSSLYYNYFFYIKIENGINKFFKFIFFFIYLFLVLFLFLFLSFFLHNLVHNFFIFLLFLFIIKYNIYFYIILYYIIEHYLWNRTTNKETRTLKELLPLLLKRRLFTKFQHVRLKICGQPSIRSQKR